MRFISTTFSRPFPTLVFPVIPLFQDTLSLLSEQTVSSPLLATPFLTPKFSFSPIRFYSLLSFFSLVCFTSALLARVGAARETITVLVGRGTRFVHSTAPVALSYSIPKVSGALAVNHSPTCMCALQLPREIFSQPEFNRQNVSLGNILPNLSGTGSII